MLVFSLHLSGIYLDHYLTLNLNPERGQGARVNLILTISFSKAPLCVCWGVYWGFNLGALCH